MAGGSVLYVNDTDTSTLGLIVSSVTGLGDVPQVTLRSRERYGWAGAMEATVLAKQGMRTLTVTGIVKATSVATLETNLDALKLLCFPNVTCRVRFANNANREWVAKLTDFVVTPLGSGGQFVNPWQAVSLKFLCPDPFGYDLSNTVIGSITNAGDTACAVGTAPSRPVLRCTGAATNPLWTYKNAGGTTITTLQLTITVAASDWVEVDSYNMTIRKSVSSVITDALSTLSTGDFIVLDPKDGPNPTLRCSVGTGQATYKKAYR